MSVQAVNQPVQITGNQDTPARSSASSMNSNSNSNSARRVSPPRRSQYAVLVVLSSVNDTFETKNLMVPFLPDLQKLGRQTNVKTTATPENGYFDSRVLSRQHAELWAEKSTGRVWLRDSKSSNGTYINGQRLSAENVESEPFELKKNDYVDFGIDIAADDKSSAVYKKISAKVERITIMPLTVSTNSTPTASPFASPLIKPVSTPSTPVGPKTTSLSTQSSNGLNEKLSSISPISSPGPRSVNGNVNGNADGTSKYLPGYGSMKDRDNLRNLTLNALKAVDNESEISSAVFGPSSLSIDSMALLHARETNSGPYYTLKPDIVNNATFELAAKRLVQEIRKTKAETAKLLSVKNMLKEYQVRMEEDPKLLELQSQNNELKRQLSETQDKLQKLQNNFDLQQAKNESGHSNNNSNLNGNQHPALLASHMGNRQSRRPKKKIFRNSDTNNLALLFSTTILMVITGICIMLFFNPPS